MKSNLNHTPSSLLFLQSLLVVLVVASCSKKESTPASEPAPDFSLIGVKTGSKLLQTNNYDVPVKPVIELTFSAPINRSSAATAISLTEANGTLVKTTASYSNSDNTLTLSPDVSLQHLKKYALVLSPSLQSVAGGHFTSAQSITFLTSLDSARKFPALTDDSLLTLVQKQTFKYFWEFGHPVSGLARERNTSGDVVTSGGSGFGIMALLVGVSRGFVTRPEGFGRMKMIVDFLKNKAQTFHGAFPHWLNGASGLAVPFSSQDNGADLVETSYLMQGLLTARQFFNGNSTAEATLRDDINTIWQGVDWTWFRQNNQNVLYWHWSPSSNWAINMQVKGWNEALITYVMAASSPTSAIPKTVYDQGWASNGGMRNGKSFYGIQLPLGPDYGGPLFFSHYSFLGIDPNGLIDAYASYFDQTKAHAQINNKYCLANPKGYYGYSDSAWGLTASDIQGGYAASSPTNDLGVVAPTAALSSFPYTPAESMKALKFFYYVLGDQLWKEYGFVDAFSLKDAWFADSFLAIDQGPIVVMIENYRTGLLWKLFMSCPEVKQGLRSLGFQSPYI